MLMIEFGGKAIKTARLTLKYNMICILIGSIELIWALLVKCIPLSWFRSFVVLD